MINNMNMRKVLLTYELFIILKCECYIHAKSFIYALSTYRLHCYVLFSMFSYIVLHTSIMIKKGNCLIKQENIGNDPKGKHGDPPYLPPRLQGAIRKASMVTFARLTE